MGYCTLFLNPIIAHSLNIYTTQYSLSISISVMTSSDYIIDYSICISSTNIIY